MQEKQSDNFLYRQLSAGKYLLAAVCLLLFPFGLAHAKPAAPSISAASPGSEAIEVHWGWTRGTETCRVDGFEIQYKHFGLTESDWPDADDVNTRNVGKFTITENLGSTGDISKTFTIGASSDGVNSGEDGVALSEVNYDIRVRIRDTSSSGGCEASDFSPLRGGAPIMGPDSLSLSPMTLKLYEGGSSGSISVKLSTKPTSDVTVRRTLASGPIDVKTKVLTFTPTNWNTAQTVTVSPKADNDNVTTRVSLNFGAKNVSERLKPSEFGDEAHNSVTVIVYESRPSVSISIPSSRSGNITASFSEIVSSSGSSVVRFNNSSIDSLITLTQNNNTGTAIPFDATISGSTVTIDPTGDLPTGRVFVGIDDDYWRDDGSMGTHSDATFTIDSGGQTDLVTEPIPAVSVADAEAVEGPGVQLAFVVTLNRGVKATDGTVTVDYATSNGSATAGSDYTATSGTLTFGVGQSSKTVNVTLLDDAHDEGNETMSLLLSNPVGMTIADGEGIGTISNVDPFIHAWLGRLARTLAEQHVDVVTKRMKASREPGAMAYVAGHSLNLLEDGPKPDFVFGSELDANNSISLLEPNNSRISSLQNALDTFSFSLTGNLDAAGGSVGIWGQVAQNSYAGREDKILLDGKVTSSIAGVDYGAGDWLGGIAVSASSGTGNYHSNNGEVNGSLSGNLKAKLISLTTYGAGDISERTQIWGAVSHGLGSLILTLRDNESEKTNLAWNMAAGGMSSMLREYYGGRGGLHLVADAFWTSAKSDRIESLAASQATVTQLRFGLKSHWNLKIHNSILSPSLALRLRHDGGDVETGLGVELGAGLVWKIPGSGFSLDLSSRHLLTHKEKDMKVDGFSAGVSFGPDLASSRGLSVSLRYEQDGKASDGLDAMLANGLPSNRSESDHKTETLRLDAAYGLPAFGGSFTGTPHAGVALFEEGRDIYLGWRLAPADQNPYNFSMGFKASTRQSEGMPTENIVELDMGMRW